MKHKTSLKKLVISLLIAIPILLLSLCACELLGGSSQSNNNNSMEIHELIIEVDDTAYGASPYTMRHAFMKDEELERFLDNISMHYMDGYTNYGYFTEQNGNGMCAIGTDGRVTAEFKNYLIENKPDNISIYLHAEAEDAKFTLVYEGESKTYNVKMHDYFNPEDLVMPEKYGYIFCGWREEGGYTQTGIYVEKYDATYYAFFLPCTARTKIHDPLASYNNGTRDQEFDYDSDYRITYTEYDGYNFVGYFSEENGEGTKFTDENGNSLSPWSLLNETDKYNDRISIYAHYIPAEMCTVTIPNDGFVTSFTVTYMDAYMGAEYRLPVERYATEGKKFEYITPSDIPEGYYFAGWFEDAGLRDRYDFSQTLTSDITLYPRFNKLPDDVIGSLSAKRNFTYVTANSKGTKSTEYIIADDATVTLSAYAAIASDSSKPVYVNVRNVTDGTNILIGELTKDGRGISANDLNLSCGDVIRFSVSTTGDPIPVEFKINGFNQAEGAYADIPDYFEYEVTSNNSYKLPAFSKYDYDFMGYYTEPDGGGTQCTDKNGKSLGKYDFGSDVTLYPYFVLKETDS